MGQITVEHDVGGIAGLCLITPVVHGDSRGYFTETYSRRDMHENGIDTEFVQDNQAMSTKGVLRGLHFQIAHPQAKLFRVIAGEVFDAVVDMREGSESYGQWYGVILTAENARQLYVPRGFAHGYLVLSDSAVIAYKCDDFYHPGDEGGIAWNDPGIGIEWPRVVGEYSGSAKSDGYVMEDGTPLHILERDQNWKCL